MTPLPSSRSSLLLLPAPPSQPTPQHLHAAYHAPLSTSISRLASSSATSSLSPAILTVAVTGTNLPPNYQPLQTLLARLYSLIASLLPDSAAENVDVRVILVDHVPGRDYTSQYTPYRADPSTTVPDLSGLAAVGKHHPWDEILHPSSEQGYVILQEFLAVAEKTYRVTFLHKQLVPVPGGLTLTTSTPPTQGLSTSNKRYKTVCLGGTFDHLHPGHKLLLHAATLLISLPSSTTSNPTGPSVFIIGISGDALLVNKKFASELEPWPLRAHAVLTFLSTILSSATPVSIPETIEPIGDNEEIQALFCQGRLLVRCVNIPDPFGPTISEEDVDAIVVSGETRGGGTAINDKRAGQGWKGLEVYEIDVLEPHREEDDGTAKDPNDFSAKISSTEIRKRRAERKG